MKAPGPTGNGDTRSANTGSSSRRSPSISTYVLEWPSQNARRPLAGGAAASAALSTAITGSGLGGTRTSSPDIWRRV
jgi:hypothetical protein